MITTKIRFERIILADPSRYERYITEEAKKTELDAVNECVLKIFFKKKYLILKGNTAIGALKCIFRLLRDYSGTKSENLPDDNLYKHFVKYFWGESRGYTFKIKVLLASENHFELLKCEQKSLWRSMKDPNCLNNTIDAYLPIYREETGSYGWVNTGSMLTFLKWKSKNLPSLMLETNVISNQIDTLSL